MKCTLAAKKRYEFVRFLSDGIDHRVFLEHHVSLRVKLLYAVLFQQCMSVSDCSSVCVCVCVGPFYLRTDSKNEFFHFSMAYFFYTTAWLRSPV